MKFLHVAASAVYCTTTFGGVSDEWLLWLCIAFGVLFAIMLLINIFLCSAMTCSFSRSEMSSSMFLNETPLPDVACSLEARVPITYVKM